ncbi:DUF6879 family protein [Nocardia sp. NPDC050793]|uniref:DUF6879 family protein n=1 Tax=Nocardia sp. NPDC050793 TaxID=3155159 RepID=UPI0033FD268C
MLLLQGDAVNDLLGESKREALHLELQDTYDTPEESVEFRQFLSGEPDDYAWMSGWAAFVRGLVERGVAVRRARVVTVPHSDWTRWGLNVAAVNVAAGEEIRYLPRHLVTADEVGIHDWWLLDGQLVAFSLFNRTGTSGGVAATADPHIVGRCRAIWGRVWELAVPHADYMVLGRQ